MYINRIIGLWPFIFQTLIVAIVFTKHRILSAQKITVYNEIIRDFYLFIYKANVAFVCLFVVGLAWFLYKRKWIELTIFFVTCCILSIVLPLIYGELPIKG